MDIVWKAKVEKYCKKYNIPLLYLAETMYEPKVVPMIRGKAFEFSVMQVLQRVLPIEEWEVDKQVMNAQIGFHDIDVSVMHRETKRIVRVECKLAKKSGYRLFNDGHSEIRVKCMRSRTLGAAKVEELAPKYGIDKKALSIHNDQYLPTDFDIVVTSIGNAFYVTDKATGLFEWSPSEEEAVFLHKLGATDEEDLKDYAFNKMYVAKASDLALSSSNSHTCSRAKCANKKNCGFIPNYPIIEFDSKTTKSKHGWVPIEGSLNLFQDFVRQQIR